MAAAAVTSGIITLTTDFGHDAPFVGTMKGVILRYFREACIVDLLHETAVYTPAEAGFWLQRSYHYFPAGTVHVAVVDPGVGTDRAILLAEYDGHIFLAPDNGLLADLLTGTGPKKVYMLDVDKLVNLNLPAPSATFHGRDIFAPLAAHVAAAALSVEAIGKPVDAWVTSSLPVVEVGKQSISGVVVSIDRYGNLISNIDASALNHFARPQVGAAGSVFSLQRTYGDASSGDCIALVNSFGVLEIAQANGNAAAALQMRRGDKIVIQEDI